MTDYLIALPSLRSASISTKYLVLGTWYSKGDRW